MSRLDAMANHWLKLEESYSKFNEVKSMKRIDFLKKLLDYKGEDSDIIRLKSILYEEMPSYSLEELKLHSDLFEKIERAHKNLKLCLEKGVEEISNLDIFCSEESSIMSENLIDLSDYDAFIKPSYISVEEAFSQGFLTNCVIGTDDYIDIYNIKNNSDHYVRIDNIAMLSAYMHSTANAIQNKEEVSKFKEKVYAYLLDSIKNQYYEPPIVFIDETLFAKTSDKVMVAGYNSTINKEKDIRVVVSYNLLNGTVVDCNFTYLDKRIRTKQGVVPVVFIGEDII